MATLAFTSTPNAAAMPQRVQRVLSVTAAAWGVPLPLPLPQPAPRVVRARVQRHPAARDCRRAAVPFSGFAISY